MYFVTFVNVFLFIAAVCSNSFVAVDKRIIGGTTAAAGAYPFMVSLRSPTNWHICGGTIINKRWVLTTADCLDKSSSFLICVGSNSISSGTCYSQMSILKHPLFTNLTYKYDAGVISTTTDIVFSSTVAAFNLSSSLPSVGSSVTAIGWGYTNYTNMAIPDQLQVLSTTFILRATCQTSYNGVSYNLQESQFCTYHASTGTCLGDGGGAIIYNGAQIGIISLGMLCAVGFPDIHTSMEVIIPWVLSNTLETLP